ncbi:MAG: serine hydrolase domain-containing protein [Pseudomonadota bacterium]
MTSIRNMLLIISALAGGACATAEQIPALDQVLEAGVADGQIPGVVAMAATAEGVFYQGAAGFREQSSQSKMTVDTIARIASMTKAITSVATLQLIEQGRLGLDQAAADHLPQLRDVKVLAGFDEDGQPILRPAKRAVTVRHLLTHTSGYVYALWNEALTRYEAATGSSREGLAFLASPLAFEPGQKWEYGVSTDILGVLVETVSGQSLDDYFREHIFKPLAMTDSYFIVPEDKLPRLATTYNKSAEGELTAIPYSRPSGEFFSGGGGLRSTAGDYVRFMRAILNGGALEGERILTPASVDLMAENHIGELDAAGYTKSMMPGVSNSFDFFPGSVDQFGLGFLINAEPVPGGRSAGSLAWAGLYNSYYWIDRERGICGVLITQVLPFFDADVLALLTDFERAVYAAAPQR